MAMKIWLHHEFESKPIQGDVMEGCRRLDWIVHHVACLVERRPWVDSLFTAFLTSPRP